jgi:GDPmannose 4,6-dehydratase
VDSLIGDASKAADVLGWVPRIHTPQLARIMVEADVAALAIEGGHYVDTVESAP